MDAVAAARPELTLALNEPYQIDDESDWFIPKHAEPRNLPNCLIEIRNDQISSPEEVSNWAVPLAQGMRNILEKLA